MRKGAARQFPEGLRQMGVRFTLPAVQRLERELERRRRRAEKGLTISDVIRELVNERLDQLEPSARKTGT